MTTITTNYKDLTRELLLEEAMYAESSVNDFFVFCEKQYAKLYKSEFHDDKNSFYQWVCGSLIFSGFNLESVRFNITYSSSDINEGIRQAEQHDKDMRKLYDWFYKVDSIVTDILKNSDLTNNLDKEKQQAIIDDISAMSVYLIPENRFTDLIQEYEDKIAIIELFQKLSNRSDSEIRSFIINSSFGQTTLSSKITTSEFLPLLLDKFISSRMSVEKEKSIEEIVKKIKDEHDELKTLENAYDFFVVRLLYCILIEHEIVIGKERNNNFLGLKDKKGHAISNATEDSLLVVKILHMLGVFNDKLKDLDKSNSESKSYINTKLKLENKNVVFNKKIDLINLIKKDHFFEKLERYFYKFGLLDPTPDRRNRVKKYCIPRLIDASIVKKKQC